MKQKSNVFLGFPYFFYDQTDTGNLISGSSAFSKSSLYIWKFSVHILLKPSLKDFKYYLAGMWNDCNCAAILTLPFFGIEMKTDLFQFVTELCLVNKYVVSDVISLLT